ncbi:hypothetical protein IFM89_004827 [Coptis chinensis]|uniref:Wall-associated receptor kinase C-terminal domain-containing protein n=1 Tax=Coptis chinensis TaxID=261450 RepID=A0A835H6R1_9MAGN|nr:hypothetical protein IFM89_004827 [Coptis chinensis]
MSSVPNILVCTVDAMAATGFHAAFSSDQNQIQTFAPCLSSIDVNVLQEAHLNFNPMTVDNISIVEEVLRNGFEVEYEVNVTYCLECEKSGRQCGFNRTVLQNTCFCPYGVEQTQCTVKVTHAFFYQSGILV